MVLPHPSVMVLAYHPSGDERWIFTNHERQNADLIHAWCALLQAA